MRYATVHTRRRSTAARLLRSWIRIPQGAWMFVCFEFCVLSGRGLSDGLITRPEESYRLWCVVVCVQETSKTRRLKHSVFFRCIHNLLYIQLSTGIENKMLEHTKKNY